MNIAFFLTPKKDVACLNENSTMRQALEKMEYHRYSSIPILDDLGKYTGTITEGDLLWKIKNTPDLNFRNSSKILLKDVPRHMDNKPVLIDSDIENLLSLASGQNFIPVVDDQEIFIGIIKRSDIINYCYRVLCKEENIPPCRNI